MNHWIGNYPELANQIREWLGFDGIKFFSDVKEKHGKVNAVWDAGGFPHCVHFQEGMAVRNKLRELTNFSWTDHEYDDRWVEIIEEAIK